MIETVATIFALVATVVTLIVLMGIAMEFHMWIENHLCESFECAIANGLIAVLTTLVGPLFAGIHVGEFVHKWMIG